MKKFSTLINMYHYLTGNNPSRYVFGDTPWQDEWKDILVNLKHDIETVPAMVGATYQSVIDIPDYGEVNTMVEINRINGIWTLTERIAD